MTRPTRTSPVPPSPLVSTPSAWRMIAARLAAIPGPPASPLVVAHTGLCNELFKLWREGRVTRDQRGAMARALRYYFGDKRPAFFWPCLSDARGERWEEARNNRVMACLLLAHLPDPPLFESVVASA